ncbi:sensor histidine kinase [Cognatiyoonia sp. IB215182]|uniref:sensor histidine kinase n=1 Tax=Cognatiyoonia sp. IB215182 TaxID=3097353 RepID=UPI002A143222|nr:ATP-binding protein [Cognatiyoonia sp. IB215182]MDX8355487.1 ATP-binding protein [Cognatiyoonia sp. IB215182]
MVVSPIEFESKADPQFTDEAWSEVLAAVDAAYSELVSHQNLLEEQNEKLHEFRRFLTSILSSVSDIMIIVGRNATIAEVSASLIEATGLAGEGLIGLDAGALFEGDSKSRLLHELDALRFSREAVRFEAELKTAESSEPYEVSIAARIDDRGKMIGAVIVGRPLGELRRAYSELELSHESLKEAQSQLVRNEKLASLGRLLAGVAHELNNPISFVYANAHALEKYIMRFEEYFDRVEAGASREELVALRGQLKLDRELRNLRAAIDGAREGSERVRDIVADLRRLSVTGAGAREAYDLVEAARVAARWVARGSKADVDIRFEGLDELSVHGNSGHIQQIVMNLVQNAIDALKGRDDATIVVSTSVENGNGVLTVSDNGPGIDADVASAIFDPFFTTKPVGEGTGLGLSISNKIAEEHGGRLSHTNLNPGSAFRLELPMEEET